MLIYNTLSGKKENLDKVLDGSKKIRLFVCGPTVYDHIQIGNVRTYLAFDLIAGYLRSRGYKVFYLQNITDIDDKIIQKANWIGVAPDKIAKRYEKAYHQDEKKLGISEVNKYAPATQYIRQIIKQVQTLIRRGYAYKIEDDGYYFDISKFPDYGKLAKRTAFQAEDSISRIDEAIHKKNKGDFALWKFSKPGDPTWSAPLGKGRPGWHIEDTAITEYHFGPQYDLHGGGVDLKFPHHEAEIAQQEAASGKKPLVKIWVHAGPLLVNGQKMSKSLKNFITVQDFLKKYSAAVLRYLVIQHHYRSPLDYKENLAIAAKKTLDSLAQFLAKLKLNVGNAAVDIKIEEYEKAFHQKMSDDFNTPAALAVIFDLVNELNKKMWALSGPEAKIAGKWLKDKLKTFKIKIKLPGIPLKITRLAAKRELSRTRKQFLQSDALRKQIGGLGYIIEDTPRGPFVWPKALNN